MKNRDKTGIFINILILIIAICVMILFFKYYMKDNTVVDGILTSETNIIVASIKGEKKEDENNNKDDNKLKSSNTELPILEENINANSKNTAATSTVTKYKYYYEQLDNNAKEIYKAIENNVEKIKSGTYVIDIPSEVGKILETENGQETLNKEFQSAWDAIIMDDVELFFIDVSKVTLEIRTTTYSRGKTYKLSMKPNSGTYLEDNFESEEKVNTAISQVRSMRDQFISKLSGNEYEKIVQLNELLIENLEYGNEYGNNAYNIYGALLQRNCVCEGYAETFKYIMEALNIPCILVIGTAENSDGNNENHEWNYVKINNNWYAMDVTWNDPIIIGGGKTTNDIKRKYLLKGNSINNNHFPNGKVSEYGIVFSYPELSSKDYK